MTQIRGTLLAVAPATVHANPWNPNKQDEREYEATVESLEDNGQVVPLVVRDHPEREGEYELIDGEHRIRAVLDLGWDSVQVNNLGQLPDDEAQYLNGVLTMTRGQADSIELAKLLALAQTTWQREYAFGRGLPYDPESLGNLLELASDKWQDRFPNEWAHKEDDDPGTMRFGPYDVQAEAGDLLQAAFDLLKREEGFSEHKAFEMIVVEWLQTKDMEAALANTAQEEAK